MSKSTDDFTVVICTGCVCESPVGPLRSHQRSLCGDSGGHRSRGWTQMSLALDLLLPLLSCM